MKSWVVPYQFTLIQCYKLNTFIKNHLIKCCSYYIEVIGDFIENALVEEYKLIKKIIPVESEEDNDVAKSRIYLRYLRIRK
jgi:hypothetical protein